MAYTNIALISDLKTDSYQHGGIKSAGIHLEEANPPLGGREFFENAVEAETAERHLTVRQALKTYKTAVFWSFAASLVVIMDTYDAALLGNVIGLPVFREKYGRWSGNAIDGYQLTPSWHTALQQAATVGNILGIVIASWFQTRYGHRRTIQSCLVLVTGSIFVVFFAPNVEVLFVGEFLCGMPWGAFVSSGVSYASEITPVTLRGYLTSFVNLSAVIGYFLAACVLVGVQSREDEWSYKIPFAIQWVWPIPLFFLITFAPESPWWLVQQDKLEEAEKAVARLSDKSIDPKKTVAMMIRTNQQEIENTSGVSYLACFRGTDLRRTEIACMGYAIQLLAGSAYGNQGTYVFEQAGLNTADSFKFNLGQYSIGIVGTCLSWVLMTYVGRRKIFLSGLGVLSLLLFLVGVLAIPSSRGNSGAKWGQAGLVLSYVFVYDLTIGPLAYCIIGDISSTRLRGLTVGLARVGWNIVLIIAHFLNTYMQNPTAWNWKGYAGLFWFGSCFGCLVWTYYRLPECKGRTFRELDVLFHRRVPARKFKETVISPTDDVAPM